MLCNLDTPKLQYSMRDYSRSDTTAAAAATAATPFPPANNRHDFVILKELLKTMNLCIYVSSLVSSAAASGGTADHPFAMNMFARAAPVAAGVFTRGRSLVVRLGSRFCGKNGVSVGTSRSRTPAKLQYEPRVDVLQHDYNERAAKRQAGPTGTFGNFVIPTKPRA